MSKKNGNIRRKRRAWKNLFWLVRNTDKHDPSLILFNREPHRDPWRSIVGFEYHENTRWFSRYESSYPSKKVSLKFPDVGWKEPIKVKLVLSQDTKNSDMYIQRYKNCLFIDNEISKYTSGRMEVRHFHRISPKLFPEITENSGIVGVNIERI